MKQNKVKKAGLIIILAVFCFSCKKGFLDDKPNQSIVILNSIKNLQGLLDNENIFYNNNAGLSEYGAGDFYYLTPDFAGIQEESRNIYTWAPGSDIFTDGSSIDWDESYKQIFYTNTVLEGLAKIDPDPSEFTDWANSRGSALFYRSYAFYNLAQLFCKPYIPSAPNDDPGIVLRLDSDINLPAQRATVQQTYDRLINDLLESVDMLPVTPLFLSRPSKPAAYGMLARVYLSMQNYDKALLYADSCLQLFNTLIDFNSLNTVFAYPFPIYPNNAEMIFAASHFPSLSPDVNHAGIVDSFLYRKYDMNDLRKTVFFRTINGQLKYFGSYFGSGTSTYFGGLATDEMLLIRAECFARSGNKDAAISDVNKLLQKRWKTGTFSNLVATDANDALQKIIEERRKELCFRCLRWTDLRRLNQDNQFKTTLIRVVNGQTYTLPPNDNRYVYPIAANEILFSGITQNPR